jgi:hypothetical protein
MGFAANVVNSVNMYASTWICTKRRDVQPERTRLGSVEKLSL